MEISLNNRVAGFLGLLLIFVFCAYANTLSAPFNFDDAIVIETEVVEVGSMFFDFYPPRYRHLFYLSLVFNYAQGELDPFGYHLVNISLHFFTSVVVFFIAFITITRGMFWQKREAFSIAVITTLLFALNPVQSETVNYISARAVGMSSFFYLLALLFFILGSFRELSALSRYSLYLLSLTVFIASLLSKETALIFPATALLYDICFMRNEAWTSIRNRLLFFYLPFLACGVLSIFKVLSMKMMIISWWQKIDFNYALKQAMVVGHSIRLLLIPIGLTFDYDFPDAFFPHPVIRAWPILLALGIILLTARFFRNALAIVSFGILWFLLVLSPTNSVLPRTDLLSERNLYLPSFSIFLLFSTTVYHFVLENHNRAIVKKIGVGCLVSFLLFQAVLLFERNLLYKDNILLWEDTLNKAPNKLRALHNLSHFYLLEKNYEKAFIALQALSKSKASPHYIAYAHSNLGTLYLKNGEYLKAEDEFKMGIKAKPSLPSNYLNLGTIFAFQGRYQKAKEAYEQAESLYKNYKWGYRAPPELFLNKARLLLKVGLYQEAESSATKYLSQVPAAGPAHFVLGQIYAAMGKYKGALQEYNQTGDDPKLKAQAYNNKALIFINQNLFHRALEELNKAITNYPNLLDAHYNLGSLLIQTKGDPAMARKHLEIALNLTTDQESQRRINLALNTLP